MCDIYSLKFFLFGTAVSTGTIKPLRSKRDLSNDLETACSIQNRAKRLKPCEVTRFYVGAFKTACSTAEKVLPQGLNLSSVDLSCKSVILDDKSKPVQARHPSTNHLSFQACQDSKLQDFDSISHQHSDKVTTKH